MPVLVPVPGSGPLPPIGATPPAGPSGVAGALVDDGDGPCAAARDANGATDARIDASTIVKSVQSARSRLAGLFVRVTSASLPRYAVIDTGSAAP